MSLWFTLPLSRISILTGWLSWRLSSWEVFGSTSRPAQPKKSGAANVDKSRHVMSNFTLSVWSVYLLLSIFSGVFLCILKRFQTSSLYALAFEWDYTKGYPFAFQQSIPLLPGNVKLYARNRRIWDVSHLLNKWRCTSSHNRLPGVCRTPILCLAGWLVKEHHTNLSQWNVTNYGRSDMFTRSTISRYQFWLPKMIPPKLQVLKFWPCQEWHISM